MAFWIFTIIRETADAIARSHDDEDGKRIHKIKIPADFRTTDRIIFTETPNGTAHYIYSHNSETNASTSPFNCDKYNALNTIHRQFSPYLYPFIIEYCILIVGIWYMIWANINQCPRKTLKTSGRESGGDNLDSPIDSGESEI